MSKIINKKQKLIKQKTGAYIELASDPLWTVFDKVVQLLNNLRSKDHIRVWQLNKMMPKRDKVALAYLYFIPKPHKVILEPFLLRYCCLFYLFFVGKNTIKTHCFFDEYTNNWHFEILR
jgi:hypothetical protein